MRVSRMQAQDILDIDPPAVPYPEPPSLPADAVEAIAAQVEELAHIATHAPAAAGAAAIAAAAAAAAAAGSPAAAAAPSDDASFGGTGAATTPPRSSAVYLQSENTSAAFAGGAKAASMTEGAPKSATQTAAGTHVLPPPSLVNDFVVGLVNAVIVRAPPLPPLLWPSHRRTPHAARTPMVYPNNTLEAAGDAHLCVARHSSAHSLARITGCRGARTVPARSVQPHCVSAIRRWFTPPWQDGSSSVRVLKILTNPIRPVGFGQ